MSPGGRVGGGATQYRSELERRDREKMQGGEEATAKEKLPHSFSDSYKEAFKNAFPELVKDLTEDGLNDPEISDGIRHLQRVSMLKSNLSLQICKVAWQDS